MFLESKYQIEFSKSKEDVLENIKNSIFRTSPNIFAKNFNGKVFDNGFRVKIMGTEPLTFKGSFSVNKNNEETLELSVGIRYLDIIFYLLFFFAIVFIIDKNYEEDYKVAIVYLGLFIFVTVLSFINAKKSKKLFFNFLEKLDKEYKIVSKNNLLI
jgi:ABC-type multidrug transport system fused ATPase/permease subunit